MSKKYDELSFTDDFMFSKILYDDMELTRELLELILDRKIRKVVTVDEQHSVAPRYDAHGVRFDVYAEDDENSVFDIEMQVRTEADLPQRSRYYHTMLNMDLLRKGRPYRKLKDCYVIFICKGAMRLEVDDAVYYYDSRCRNHPEMVLGDGSHTVFVNSHYEGGGISEGMREFLRYVRTGEVSGERNNLVHKIDGNIYEARQHRRWEAEYMTFEEKLDEKLKEGIEIGREELLKYMRTLSPEEVTAFLEKEDGAAEMHVKE